MMMIMAVVATMSIIASGYSVAFAFGLGQPPGVQGLWGSSQQQCEVESRMTPSGGGEVGCMAPANRRECKDCGGLFRINANDRGKNPV